MGDSLRWKLLEFRVQSLFEPNTANRPRKPYKPLLASNGQRRHTNVRMHMQRYLQMRGDYPPGRGVAMHTFNIPLLHCCSSTGGERRM